MAGTITEAAGGTKQRGTKAKGLTNGRVAWQCPQCETYNGADEPSCLQCWGGVQPGLSESETGLVVALEPNEEASQRWRNLRDGKSPLAGDGVSDQVLESQIATVLADLQAGDCADTDVGRVSWRIDSGRKPKLFFGRERAPARGRADLAGKALLKSVRELYRIPKPGQRPQDKAEPQADGHGQTAGDPSAWRELAEDPADAGTLQDVGMARIEVSEANPRKHFDAEKLQSLAESIRVSGVLQPLLLRSLGDGRLELVAGERRYRAALEAGLNRVPAIVRTLDDKQAAEVRLLENSLREDLNPIERAEALRRLHEEHGIPQRQLAAEYGLSQAQVSHELRFLELPEAWQQRLITRAIGPYAARWLVPWIERPQVLDLAAQYVEEDFPVTDDGSLPSDEVQRAVRTAARDCSRPLRGFETIGRPGERLRWVEVALSNKDRKREDLDVVELKFDRGPAEKRAFNVELWEQLQQAGEERRRKRKEKAASSTERRSGARPLTATEEKARQEAKRQKAEQFRKRLYRWKVAWLQARLAERLESASITTVLRLLMYFALSNERGPRGEEFRAAIKAAGGKRPKDRWVPRLKTVDAGLQAEKPAAFARRVLATWILHDPEWGRGDTDYQMIEQLAEDLGVDVAQEWRLSRDFLELHTKDQLWSLANEWKITSDPVWLEGAPHNKRGELIDGLLAVDERSKSLPAPKELVKCKKPKGF